MREFDPNRLKQLLVAAYTSNEHERGTAANLIYRYWQDTGVHPTQVEVSYGTELIARNQKMIKTQQEQLRRLGNERLYLRRHVSPAILREAVRAGEIDDQDGYCELLDLAIQLWPNGSGLARNWKRSLSDVTGCSPAEIERWERGLLSVPQSVLDKLRARSKPKKVKAGLPRLSLPHMAILHAIAKSGSASHQQIANMMLQVLRIDPVAETQKRSTWRHPITARLPEIHTASRFGKPLVKGVQKAGPKTFKSYGFTDFGREAYYENLPRFTAQLP
jgi:hypothetical protein